MVSKFKNKIKTVRVPVGIILRGYLSRKLSYPIYSDEIFPVNYATENNKIKFNIAFYCHS